MRIRRYYKKGCKYKYTISDEYLNVIALEKGLDQAGKIDNANYELILDNDEEMRDWFFDCLNRVIENPRFYLDNLDYLPTFRVRIQEIFPKRKSL
jgi:hypothetical protein